MGKKHRGGSTGEKKAKKRATRARTSYGDEPIFSCNLKRVKRDEKLQVAIEEAKKEEAKLKQYSKQYGSDVDSSDAEVSEALTLACTLLPLSLSHRFHCSHARSHSHFVFALPLFWFLDWSHSILTLVPFSLSPTALPSTLLSCYPRSASLSLLSLSLLSLMGVHRRSDSTGRGR